MSLPKPPLIYVLHSGNLYGTERMALYTAQGLSSEFEPVIFAPPGLAVDRAHEWGISASAYNGALHLSRLIAAMLRRHSRLAFISTGVVHSAICLLLNLWYRRRIVHLHLVHGGACERLSYGRKKYLNHFPVQFVAVSDYVRQRLTAHGVAAHKIRVIENFLPQPHLQQAGRRAFNGETPARVIVISRLDPEKQVGLLLEALEQAPDLQTLQFHIYGTGPEQKMLQGRARKSRLQVVFKGFHPDIQNPLSQSDLLLHLCPVEPFGLAIIEAMAAGVPVLVPDSGGAGLLVDDNLTGFRFEANNAASLARRLRQFIAATSNQLNQIAERARQLHSSRFCSNARILDYRQLLTEGLA